nr:hypothetical protein [Fictibacillus enclensis]
MIKGRAGSGNNNAEEDYSCCKEKGYDVEIYYCGLVLNSFDMVILREKGIAIFDSTAPHEYEPERKIDESF